MVKIIVIISFFIAFSSPVYANDGPPADEVIAAWWKKHSSEKITFMDKPSRVTLLSGEPAYLVKVGFYSRGRNEISQVLLIRPKLQEVREVGYPVSHDFEVHNLDRDKKYVSEISTVSLGSGQGTTRGTKAIIQLDGWDLKILHQADFNDNLGSCYGGCYSKEVVWSFVNIDNKWGNDLLETIIINDENSKPKTSIQINTYLFKDGHFTKSNIPVVSGTSEKAETDSNSIAK